MEQEKLPLKILELHSENFGKLKIVDISPKEDTVVLSGENEAGKSTILDVILSTLEGKTIVDPIRHGEERAVNIVNLGRFIVRRVWTKKGDYLEVMTPEGAKYGSPRALLDKIKGALSFDPMEFARMCGSEKGRREQRELLMKLVGLNFEENDKKRQELYSDRSYKNKDIKALEIQRSQIEVSDEKLPTEEISISEELKKLRELEDLQKLYSDYLDECNRLDNQIANKEKEYSKSVQEIARLKELLKVEERIKEDIHAEAFKLKQTRHEMQPPEKITDEQIEKARNSIGEIEGRNVKIRAGKRYLEISKKLEATRKEADAISQKISTLDEEKISKVASCKFPVEGLAVNDEAVIYNDTPLERISDGKKTAISTAIAMALNPRLRVILIKDASLLDSKNKKIITEMAKEKGYQVWMEVTDETGKIGIYIEEGEIKAINGQKAPEVQE